MTATLWIALSAIAAALIARGVKISEFRQSWIDGLRADISEYVSKAHEWIEFYLEFNEELEQKKKAEMAKELNRIKYDSFHVLRRIELRFKPDDDNANTLLGELRDLLNPGKLPPENSHSEWTRLADGAVANARSLLKEEWETTKNPLRKLLIKLRGVWRRKMARPGT